MICRVKEESMKNHCPKKCECRFIGKIVYIYIYIYLLKNVHLCPSLYIYMMTWAFISCQEAFGISSHPAGSATTSYHSMDCHGSLASSEAFNTVGLKSPLHPYLLSKGTCKLVRFPKGRNASSKSSSSTCAAVWTY